VKTTGFNLRVTVILGLAETATNVRFEFPGIS